MTMAQKSSLKILALDTSSPRGSIALLDGREVTSELRLHSLETHSARLLKSVRFLLDGAGWKLCDLDLIAAGIGPGSFTGIRIGIATALGLAQTLGIPFAGASGLEALARQASLPEGRLGVAMDAQRSQIYYAEYETSQNGLRQVRRPGLWHPELLKPALARRRLYLTGDGAARYIDQLRERGEIYPRLLDIDPYIAGSIGRLALMHKRTWRAGQGLNCDPLYIRPPDARKPKGRK